MPRHAIARSAALGAALVVAAAAACSSTSGGGSSGNPAPPSAVACGLTSGSQELSVDGEARTFDLALPAEVTEPGPAVVLFHGYASSAEQISDVTALDVDGPAQGVAVAVPQGVDDPATWHIFESDSTDNEFIDRLLDQLAEDPCIDEEQIWLAGHSGGSAYAGVYGCGHVDQIAGLWLNAGLPPPVCPEDAGIDVRIVHGTADPVVPFDGGSQAVDDDAIELDTVPVSAAGWARRAGCPPDPIVSSVADADLTTWSGCAGGATVSLAAVAEGGHSWPVAAGDDLEGEPRPAYPATCELLRTVAGGAGPACGESS